MLCRRFPEHATPLSRLTRLFVRERWGLPQRAPRELELADVTSLWTAIRSIVLSRLVQLLRSLQVRNILHLLQEMSQWPKRKVEL